MGIHADQVNTETTDRDEYERVYDAIKESPTALIFTDDGKAVIALIHGPEEIVPLAEFTPIVSEPR